MPPSTTPSPKLIQALRHLLEPLVRLLLNAGMAYPAFAELLKRVYVDIAEREFALDGKPQSESRISLLSGVHRKDVKRLRALADEPLNLGASSHASLQAQLIAKWLGEPAYQDPDGRPRPLARLASQCAERSFEQMVCELSTDVRPRVFLDEWLRKGLVQLDAQDQVSLNLDALLQAPGEQEKIDFFGRNLHDHLAASVSNLEGQAAPFMDRCVFYHGLTAQQVQQLKQRAEQLSMDALLEINRSARSMLEQNQGDAAANQRMHFGAYFYHQAEDDTDAAE